VKEEGEAFVGRVELLRRLRSALDAARKGHGGVWLLAGEPGGGKSSALERFLQSARGVGVELFGARCRKPEWQSPLGPWLEIGQQIQRGARGLLMTEQPELSPTLPVRVSQPGLGANAARLRLLDQLSASLVDVAAWQTRVIWLDDLHLCDPLSLALLAYLAADLGNRRVLVIATLDEREMSDPARKYLSRLSRLRETQRFSLPGLSREEIDEYLCAALGRKVQRGLAERLLGITCGNPFLLVECVAQLRKQGRPLEDTVPLVAGLPSTSGGAVQLRLQALDPRCLSVLSTASVLGPEFSVSVLSRAIDLPKVALGEALDRARAEGLIERDRSDPDRAWFVHDLIRTAIYQSLPRSHRVKLHAAIVGALEQDVAGGLGPWGALAFHGYKTMLAEFSDRTERYARLAAADANARCAYEQAAWFVQMAVEARSWTGSGDDLQTGELLLELLRAEIATGRLASAGRALSRLERIAIVRGAPQLLAKAVLGSPAALLSQSFGAHPAPSLEGALRGLPLREKALRARLLGAIASCHDHPLSPDTRQRMADEAWQLASESGERSAARAAVRAGMHALRGPDQLHALLHKTDLLSSSPELGGDPELALDASELRYVACLTLGDAAALGRELDAIGKFAEQLHDPLRHWHAGRVRLERDLWRGRWEGARDRLHAQRIQGRRLFGSMAEFFHAVELFQWARLRGNAAHYRAADSERLERDARRAGATFNSAFALFMAQAGRLDDARRRFAALAAANFDDIAGSVDRLEPLSYLAELATVLEDRPRAQRIYDLLLPYAGLNAVAGLGWYLGSIAHYLGMLAATLDQPVVARAHFEAAAATHEQLGAMPMLSQTREALERL
jgi:eukaryotic-like serine/threonine-protein kinase